MTTAQDRIADACAYLNDVGLPNVQTLVQSVRELRAYIRAVDPEAWSADPRLTRADSILRQYAQHINA